MNLTRQYLHTELYDNASVAGVVAVEFTGQFARVFIRTSNGVIFHNYPFKPFMLLADPVMLDNAPVFTTRRKLEGNGGLCWLALLNTWHDWCQLRDYLQQTGRPEAWFGIPDACQQFLVTSGICFFRGLNCKEITVLCIAVTETGKQQDGHADILAIAVADNNGYEEIISIADNIPEQDILKRLSTIVQERDPDIVTGYRLNSYDLPFIVRRASHYGLRLALGRDGSEPHLLQSTDPHRRQKGYGIYGRSVIDTLALVRQYDQQMHPLPGNGLRQVAKWFGCTAQQDETIQPAVIDVRETIRLYQLLAPVWHQQAQLFPASFQSTVSRSATQAANALLVREYLNQNHALPAPVRSARPAESITGELLRQGRFGPVALCSLSELPASIMLAYRISSCGDDSGLILPLLDAVKQQIVGKWKRNGDLWPLPPGAFLLHTWFDLIVSGQSLFSDPVAAGEIKRLMYVLINDLLAWLKEAGAEPVAVDQQMICFVPPKGRSGEEIISLMVERLEKLLPGFAVLRCSGQYQAMFVYSQNNYAFLENNGTVVYRGQRFSRRSMEPFLLEFLKEVLALLLDGKAEAVRTVYARYLRELAVHDCPVSRVMRIETIADTLENYQKAVQSGKRNRAAVYELALATPGRWMVGDTVSYYVAGNSKQVTVHENCKLVTDFNPAHPDLNIPWYTERLHQLFKRFEPFLPMEPLLF